MKKIIVLLLFSATIYSQNVAQKKEEVAKLLCKTWVANYAMLNGLKVEQMGAMKSLKYTFKADGTYQLNDKTGKWTLNAKKKNIELYLDGTLKSTITTLQSKKFIMVLTPTKDTPKGSKFEIYFKPKV